MQRSGLILLMAGLVLTGPGSAWGEDKKPWKADAGRGEALAERLCANCHLVGDGQKATAVAGIPSLAAVAGFDGMTRQRVTNTLIAPHAPMPDMQLTMHEIGDLTAYLEKLIGRKLESDAGKGPEKARKKPKYPSPS